MKRSRSDEFFSDELSSRAEDRLLDFLDRLHGHDVRDRKEHKMNKE